MKAYHGRLALWLLASPAAFAAESNVVLDWNALMLDAIRVDDTGPTLSSRNLAILHVAIYDAVNSVERTHQPYRLQLDAPPGTSTGASALAAGYEVTLGLYPALRARTDALYETYVASFPATTATTDGLALGRTIARAILEWRGADGASTDVPYIPSDAPGQWRRTPPFFRPPLTPQWRSVKPFCLDNLDPFVAPGPPAMDSAEYAESFDQVKTIGERNSSTRTPEQSEIAIFWSDFSYTAMPPGHWHEIAATIARNHGNNLAETARLFALLSLAQADAAIVCWEAKYRFNFWRPVTAIQRADEDGNPATEKDANWNQFLPSPPFPEYPSGHSTFSKASAQVLTHFYGTDSISFTATSDSLPGVFRSFASLAACADEVGMSRIYGGFHFQFANRDGKASGKKVGDYVSANCLLANDRLPLVRLEGFDNGAALVRVHGRLGATCVLEASTDLRIWQPISTNRAAAGGVLVADRSSSSSPTRFYRAVEH
ncbi:MAG: phosphatase PAP2 family protein [Verrucomicrobia bacterium]|nr:phosphatase PAP2 family protein [Verrucomicrobiota bacterium]